jgi:predicted RNase H-like nuclease
VTSGTTFIGIDLAWRSERNASGIAIARWDGTAAAIVEVISGVRGLDEIAAIVERSITANTVIAVDAPLIIRNTTARRRCESEISRRFGARHASTHSSNLTLYPFPATHELVRRLEHAGFRQYVAHERQEPGRWFFEVYPHPAHVVLFELETIIRYKAKSRRPRSLRLTEFARLQSLLGSLEGAEPSLNVGAAQSLVIAPLDALRGQALKDHEDGLDAWFCTYLALHAWYWGAERNEIVGDFQDGYIVLPRERKEGLRHGVRTQAEDAIRPISGRWGQTGVTPGVIP